MDSESGRVVEMPALGRPFGLGMVYDCCADTLVPGPTLWNHDDLQKHIKNRPQHFNNFAISASESTEAKYSLLDIKGSMKASVMLGTIEIAGSARYLNDDKTSSHQARVTLSYLATTNIQELSMDHLSGENIRYSDVFKKKLGTHFVTSILYGAQAFLVFERDVSEEENINCIQGDFKVALSNISNVQGEAGGSGKITNREVKSVEKFTCRFYGDFMLEENPLTFQDALQVYQSLPKLLGANGENAVPLKVWMLPLISFDSSVKKLVHEISVGFVQEAQRLLEDFKDLEVRCNDALKAVAEKFPQIGEKLKHFKDMCSEVKLEFQQDLAKKLPSVRGGDEEEAVLAEILKKRLSSPFNNKNLNQWMDWKEKEIHMLNALTNMMKNTKILTSHYHIYNETFTLDHVACFVFTSLGNDENFLLDFLKCQKQQTKDKTELKQYPQEVYDLEKEQWFSLGKITENMWKKAKLFCDFAEANKEKQKIKFLAMCLNNDKHKGSTIYLYKDGSLVSDNFEPPSKPETMKVVKVTHNSVTLNVSPPRFGAENITSFCLEVRVHGEDGWKQKTEPKAGEVTVRDLKANTKYVFRCRAVTSAGVGPAHVVSDPISTLSLSTEE